MEKGLFTGTKQGLKEIGGILSGTSIGTDKGLLQSLPISMQPETFAWRNQLSFPKPSSLYVNRVDELIRNLKEANIWNQLDRFWIFATEQGGHAPVSLVNPMGITATWPSNISLVSSPKWTRLKGYTGNATSSYLSTNYNPSINAVKYGLASASIGTYTIGADSNIDGVPMGGIATSAGNNDFLYMAPNVWSGSLSAYITQWGVNQIVQGSFTEGATRPSQKGLFSIIRSNTTQSGIFKNGALYHPAVAQATSNIPSFTIPIMANNDFGTINDFSSNTYSMAFIGNGNINQSLLYSVFQQFALQVGFNV